MRIMMMKKSTLIILISTVTVSLVVFAIVLSTFLGNDTNTPDDTTEPPVTEGGKPLVPDYPLPPEDSGAETMGEEDTGKLESPEGGGSVGVVYMKDVEIDLESGKIKLLFGNPSRSNNDMIVNVLVQGHVVARSGRLLPGNRVTTIELSEEGRAMLTQEGIYEGSFVIDNYDPITGEKELVNIQIPVEITVK